MKCSFSEESIEKGTGKIFVEVTGKLAYFCSSKCQKNFNLKRKPAKVNWIRKKKAGGAKPAEVKPEAKKEAKPVEKPKKAAEKKKK